MYVFIYRVICIYPITDGNIKHMHVFYIFTFYHMNTLYIYYQSAVRIEDLVA